MKRTYKYSKLTRIIPLLGMLMLTHCTDKFEEFNTDPYGIYPNELAGNFNTIGLPIKQMQLYIYLNDPAWNTQLQQNLIGDVFSGYMASPTPYAGNVNNITYALVSGWNIYPWDDAYDGVMKPASKVKEAAEEAYPDFYAWSLVLRVEAMHRVSDIYGPIIYSKFGTTNPDGSTDYDSQKDVYYAFFNDLEQAISTLTKYAETEASLATLPFASFDLVYGGKYSQWVKFANTLRLRLALRISKVDPAKAKLEGEKALAHPLGLLATNNDNFLVKIPTTHPLNTINQSWGDIRMSAPMESILVGYEDPRLPKFFLPATDESVAGEYKGIRSGIDIDAKARYGGYSSLASFANKILLFSAAEAWFLKAEAALYNWANAGNAKENYEQGVIVSFEHRGAAGVEEYLADDQKTPKPYIDPNSIRPGENDILVGSPYLSTVKIKWDAGASTERNLERIITQKWIAMYPEGQEAWSEFRRTGYPKLFPVVVNYSAGEISTTAFIKRVKFSANEYSTNNAGVTKAVTLLGGPDTGGTALWWDID